VTLNLTEGRRQWLSELYEANSDAVFKLCRRFLNSREDAADAMHEVFLRAAGSLSEPPTSRQARAWLIRVARNYCIDLVRRRERLGLAMTILAASVDASEESIQAVEDRQLLMAVLEQLSIRDREALWLSAVERRPLADIARSFDLSYMAAAQLISRARRRALVLATRLAVILGLAWLGRAARRWNMAARGQQLAAAVVVPVMIAAVVVSSSPHAEISAAATSHAALGPVVVQRSPGVIGQLPATGPTAAPSPSPAAVPGSVVVGQITAVQSVTTPVTVTPKSPSLVPVDIDHGKGRDRDDTIHPHPGKGRGRGH
jgi:RNA polymerase sigma-70 factor (ECF subfamily)